MEFDKLEIEDKEYTIVDLIMMAKFAKSRSAAKRLVRAGAVRIFNENHFCLSK